MGVMGGGSFQRQVTLIFRIEGFLGWRPFPEEHGSWAAKEEETY